MSFFSLGQTPLFRFPPDGEKAAMRRCCSSSAQRHNVGVNAVLTLSSLQRKSFYTALRLLFRKKPRLHSHVKNYRSARFFTAHLTTAFFRLCVPPVGRNAGARSFCLREAGGSTPLFYVRYFISALRRSWKSANNLRAPAESGSAFKVRRSGSSEKNHVCAHT